MENPVCGGITSIVSQLAVSDLAWKLLVRRRFEDDSKYR
jgi:hypothetical protein